MSSTNSFDEQLQMYKDKGDYNSLNSMLGILERLPDGRQQYQLDKDRLAVQTYMDHYVKPHSEKMEEFDSFYDLLTYLVENKYYSKSLIDQYSESFINSLHSELSDFDFEFKSFIGAHKFYKQYALMSRESDSNNPQFLEDVVSKAVVVSLYLADGDEEFARELAHQIMTGKFQPATPTYLNAGRYDSGLLVSCYLLLTSDNMESIAQTVTRSLQLSKRGGGVGICLTNLRESSASIKGYSGLASGPVPVMKILEDSFSYADQLG